MEALTSSLCCVAWGSTGGLEEATICFQTISFSFAIYAFIFHFTAALSSSSSELRLSCESPVIDSHLVIRDSDESTV